MTRRIAKIVRGASLTLALTAAACGGDESVASKSAAAYRDAQARGVPVAGGHDHGGHAAPSAATGTVDHSAHGTTADAHAGIDHGAAASSHEGHAVAPAGGRPVDHAAMGHTAAGSGDHSQHDAGSPARGSAGGHDRHAGMQPDRASATDHSQHTGRTPTSNDHSQHGQAATSASGAHSPHGASRQRPAGHDAHTSDSSPTDPAGRHAGMQHGAAQPAAGHGQHQQPAGNTAHGAGHGQTAIQQPTPDPHAGHAPPSAAVRAPDIQTPVSSSAIGQVNPAATLKQDAFDAAAPLSVSEANKAAQGVDHADHQTRGITPGEDHANPPTPMPARRDRTTTQGGHDQHGVMAAPPATRSTPRAATPSRPAAAVIYSCPMHSEVTSSKPGSCPKCGMALVKKN